MIPPNLNGGHQMLPNNKDMSSLHSTNRFVREAECKLMTGLSRTRRWELEKEGKFPKRIKLSERAVAWRFSDLMNWMEERVNAV
jgi:prophage regulatory protein